MISLSTFSGYTASSLVLLTFITKDMCLLRTVAICSNVAFITYGALDCILPVLLLHLVLLPLNIVRLREIIRATPSHNPITYAALALVRRHPTALWMASDC